MQQAPDDGDRTTGSLSWALQVERYLQASDAGAPQAPGVNATRRSLLEQLQATPHSAEAWHGFLAHEEGLLPPALRQPMGLLRLYQKATELVPRPKGPVSPAFLSIWLGYARHQW